MVFSGTDAADAMKRDVARYLIGKGPSDISGAGIPSVVQYHTFRKDTEPEKVKGVFLAASQFFTITSGKMGQFLLSLNCEAVLNASASRAQQHAAVPVHPSLPVQQSSAPGAASLTHDQHRPAVMEVAGASKQAMLPPPPISSNPPPAHIQPAASTVQGNQNAIKQWIGNDVYLLTPKSDGASAPAEDRDMDALRSMLEALSPSLIEAVERALSENAYRLFDLTDIVVDEGCQPVLRIKDETYELDCHVDLEAAIKKLIEVKQLAGKATSNYDMSDVLSAAVLDKLFGHDNRMGLPGTLHRISALRTRDGSISGLTYRVGRHLPGVALPFQDLLSDIARTFIASSTGSSSSSSMPKCTSILMVGRPGHGKTTLLRDMTRMLADMGLSVMVVDSSMEIGGCDRVKHPALGKARRMEVRYHQHQTLIEAVQNHTPHVIVVDEIGTKQEVDAVRSISQRGISVIGTAHGIDLKSLMSNPVLVPLLGGIKDVTVGDMLAQRRGDFKKTRLERAGAPAFTCLVEVLGRDQWRVHTNLAASVDRLLSQGAAGVYDDE